MVNGFLSAIFIKTINCVGEPLDRHLNVVNTKSLHHKNNWTSRNLDYALKFFMLLLSFLGCIFFPLLPKPIFPYKMSFY